MPLLLLAFVVVPLVELAVIGQVSDWLGLPWTLALLLIDSLVGAVLVKREGARAWVAFRDALSAARWPGDEVAQGALVLVGGALLLTPGFVTDAVGLAAVLPPTRAVLSRLLRARLTPAPVKLFRTAAGGGQRPTSGSSGASGRFPGRNRDDDVLDVEVVSVERDVRDDRSAGPDASSGPRGGPKG
ncbi:MAG: FxsA family protein [Actinobacteria bacterium]|nr:FxsA family protein [Actinomycetota bacterium]